MKHNWLAVLGFMFFIMALLSEEPEKYTFSTNFLVLYVGWWILDDLKELREHNREEKNKVQKV